jgi:ABC-type transporter Mla subunit MlaD
VAAVVVVVVAALVLTSGSSGAYRVRAIFADAANITNGEQVKVAGVPVGSVEAVEPTPQAKAAVVMNITAAGFKDFRTDAYCIVRPQSLLGEKYVDCRPTESHAEGAGLPPKLSVIAAGQEGAGQHLLPIANTSSPVDPDLLQDITQLPEAQRLRIILNELGVGLAGRGKDLHAAIVHASPALRETNRVLAILGRDNHVLAKLAVDSDRALGPLAGVRRQVADFLAKSNTVATAAGHRSAQLAQTLAAFPAFLEQLGPAMRRISRFASETTPVFSELGKVAPAIDAVFTGLPGLARGSTTYLQSLGKLGITAGPELRETEGLLERLQLLGTSAKPFGGNLSTLLESLRSTGGIERLMDVVFLASGATNGYNALGHFLRADLLSYDCYQARSEVGSGCESNFRSAGSASSAQAARARSAAAHASGGTTGAAGSPALGSAAQGSSSRAAIARTLGLIDGSKHKSTAGASRLLLDYLLGE